MNQCLHVCLVCCYIIFHILHLATNKVYFITLCFIISRCWLANPNTAAVRYATLKLAAKGRSVAPELWAGVAKRVPSHPAVVISIIAEAEHVYCAVRTEILHIILCISWCIRNCLRVLTRTCLLAKLNVVLRAAYNHGTVINAHCEKSWELKAFVVLLSVPVDG
jgi:hypothetical protein